MEPGERPNPNERTQAFGGPIGTDQGDFETRELLLRRACGDDVELRRAAEQLLANGRAWPSGDGLVERAATLSLTSASLLIGRTLEFAGTNTEARTLRAPDELLTAQGPDDTRRESEASTVDGEDIPPPPRRPWRPTDRTLGGYQLIKAVGSGACGTVYKALDPRLDRIVAVKVLHLGDLATAAQADRFLREARNAAHLLHPAIVHVHEFGEHEGVAYIVSDFVDGMTLSDWLEDHQPTPRAAAALVAELADAIDYAHREGVVHRDIKPSNIMMDSQDRPRILDFGLARRRDVDVTMTQKGDILGTPAYMSPEQARGESHDVDGRSDVYSLGVVLYVLLTRELPFRGAVRMLIQQVLTEEPKPPRALVDTIPRDVETICLKAMGKEPHQRYATASELADDLRRFERAEPIQARPIGTIERSWKWCKRNPKLAWASGSAAGAILMTIVILASATLVLRASNHREADARAKAQAGVQLACDAVDSLLTRFGDDPGVVAGGVGMAELAFSARSWANEGPPLDTAHDRLRKDLLIRARQFYEKILRQAGDDPRLRSEHARTCLRLAKIFVWLRDFPEAIAQGDKARAILDGMPRAERDLAENLEIEGRSFALSGLASWWRFDWTKALADLKSAASIYARLTRDHPEVTDYRSLECSILNLLGRQACKIAGREAEGVEALDRCLLLCEAMLATEPDRADFAYEKARALITLSEQDENRHDYQAALVKRPEAMKVLRGLIDRDPKATDSKVLYAQGYSSLVNLETNAGHPERARVILDAMRPEVERMVAESPDIPAFRECLAIGDAAFAFALASLGDHPGAVEWAEKALTRSPASGIVMFAVACAYSVASKSAHADTSSDPSIRSERQDDLARAKQLLVNAKKAGLFQEPIYVRQMTEYYADFEPLKGDPEFERFIEELKRERPANP